jgi:hypothetical protein
VENTVDNVSEIYQLNFMEIPTARPAIPKEQLASVQTGSVEYTIVPSTEASADDDCQLWCISTCDRPDHLCTVFRNTSAFRLGTDHVAGNINEEE